MTGRFVRVTVGGVPRYVDLRRNEAPRGVPGRWTRVFTEDFNDSSAVSLLNNGKWWFGWFGNGITTDAVNSAETAIYDRSCFAVSGGQATFTIKPNSTGIQTPAGHTKPNLGAQISTDPDQGASPGFLMSYGFIEARLQQPAGNGTELPWPAFWASWENWPTGMEIDVMEGGGTDSASFNIHYGTTVGVETTNLNGLGSGRTRSVPGATTGMHTYGADIRPGSVTFYYDGAPVYTYLGTVPSTQRPLIIGNSTGGTLTGPKNLIVDYVRAWTALP